MNKTDKATKPQKTEQQLPEATAVKNKNNGVIIVDECGSQDYFGNLVVAAIHISKENVQWFKDYVIDLSNPMNIGQIFKIANIIEERCLTHVVPITPATCNFLFDQMKDHQCVVAWAYSKAVESLLEKVECQHVLNNKFKAGDIFLKKYLDMKKKAKALTIVPQEKINCQFALRSAGILAEKGYLGYLSGLNKKYRRIFPRGTDERVDVAIKDFLKDHTHAELDKIAKIHLKNLKEVMKPAEGVLQW